MIKTIIQRLGDCRHLVTSIIRNRSHLRSYRKMFPACQATTTVKHLDEIMDNLTKTD